MRVACVSYIEDNNYFYYLTDHLGNNRAVATAVASIVQRTQYYPFGLPFADAQGRDLQPYTYNGKQNDSRLQLNLMDYVARQNNNTYGRFTSMDPLAEKYLSWSPYAYVGNNPMRFIDPDGRQVAVPIRMLRTARSIYRASKTYENTKGATDKSFVNIVKDAINSNQMVTGDRSEEVTKALIGDIVTPIESTPKTNDELSREEQKSINSLEKQIDEHENKLNDYKKDPEKYDNKKTLKNAPSEEVKQKMIEGRIKKLEKEIQKFKDNIDKIINNINGD